RRHCLPRCFISPANALSDSLQRSPAPARPTPATRRRKPRRLTGPASVTWTFTHVCKGLCMGSLLLDQEFRGIHQAPEKVFEGLGRVADPAAVPQANLLFLHRRLAGQDALVEGLDDLLVAELLADQFGEDCLALRRSVIVDELAVH